MPVQKHINLKKAKAEGVKIEKNAQGYALTISAEGGKLIFSGLPGFLGGVRWKGMTHLVTDVTAKDTMDQTFTLVFVTPAAEKGDMCIINAGVLPQIRTTWPVALSLLDSQTMFIPRTPGRLKEIILGRGISLKKAVAMVLTFKKTNYEQHILIHDFYLTDELPDTAVRDVKPIVDDLGQYMHKAWSSKTASLSDMRESLTLERKGIQPGETFPNRSRFGGDLSHRFDATGFFHTHFDGKRWSLVDPDGYRFFSTGLDCCIPGDSGYIEGIDSLLSEKVNFEEYPDAFELTEHTGRFTGQYLNHSILNLNKVFGAEWKQAWMELTRSRLIRWGFNTIGNWSDKEFIRFAKLPYVWPMEDFPTTEVKIFRDFPDVFSEEYARNTERYSRQLQEFIGDEYMIGYFLRNEPEWAFVQGLMIADKVLENPADTCCKEEMIRYLQKKYGDIKALNAAWKRRYKRFEDLRAPQKPVSTFSEAAMADAKAFSEIMIQKYVTVPSQACRKIDPDHMNLGMRYAMLLDPILLSGHENFDVFSINGYDADCCPNIQKAGELSGKPVMIGEFHFGAPDAGMLAAAICSVATQHDRGAAYRVYYEGAMNSPYFVGAHYFSLNDQPVLGRFDGENCQIGAVDVCHKPYEVFLKEATSVNEEIYSLADGKRSDPQPQVNRVPRMMGF